MPPLLQFPHYGISRRLPPTQKLSPFVCAFSDFVHCAKCAADCPRRRRTFSYIRRARLGLAGLANAQAGSTTGGFPSTKQEFRYADRRVSGAV
jgi:hypothetical protein